MRPLASASSATLSLRVSAASVRAYVLGNLGTPSASGDVGSTLRVGARYPRPAMVHVSRASILLLLACSDPAAVPAAVDSPRSDEASDEADEVVEAAPRPRPVPWSRESLEPLGGDHIEARPIELLVPGGDPPADGWPFVVVTDGDLAFRDTFRVGDTLRQLVESQRVAPAVVIAVPARERTEEMTPSPASARALRRGERVDEPGGGVESFADYLVEVVLPAVQRDHRLASSGAVLGYSYGGLAAVHVGLRHPDRFSTVVAMSPSLWSAQRLALQAVAKAERLPSRFWIDVGTEEGGGNEVVPYMVADARQLRSDLREREVTVEYYEAPGRRHASDEAGQRMRWALAWALGAGPCEPNRLDLHVFELYPSRRERVPTSVLARCDDDTPRTVPPDAVTFTVEGEGARIGVDGVFHGTQPGLVNLRVRYGELEASKHVRVTR